MSWDFMCDRIISTISRGFEWINMVQLVCLNINTFML